MKTGVLWTVGAFTVGVAVGVASAKAVGMCSEHNCVGNKRRRIKIKCGAVDPVEDMDKMSPAVHNMVADVVSHECGHLTDEI